MLKEPQKTKTWNDLVAEGIAATSDHNWRLGDLALEVETTYGGHDLERYAEAIEVEYDTLREYRRVAAAYENATRVANLSWTHHREVAARDDRLDWLKRTADSNWSVAELRRQIAKGDTRKELVEQILKNLSPVVDRLRTVHQTLIDTEPYRKWSILRRRPVPASRRPSYWAVRMALRRQSSL